MGYDTTEKKITVTGTPASKNAGDIIDAASFRQMVSILDELRDHTHKYTDNYTSNCQCNCGRGSL